MKVPCSTFGVTHHLALKIVICKYYVVNYILYCMVAYKILNNEFYITVLY